MYVAFHGPTGEDPMEKIQRFGPKAVETANKSLSFIGVNKIIES